MGIGPHATGPCTCELGIMVACGVARCGDPPPPESPLCRVSLLSQKKVITRVFFKEAPSFLYILKKHPGHYPSFPSGGGRWQNDAALAALARRWADVCLGCRTAARCCAASTPMATLRPGGSGGRQDSPPGAQLALALLWLLQSPA